MIVAFALVYFVRRALFAIGVVVAVACLLDWLVRTRRIHPFHPVARMIRRVVDPVIAPVERAIIRAGGTSASVPLWALVAFVVLAAIVVSVLDFVVGSFVSFSMALAAGPAGIFIMLVQLTFGILRLALLIVVIVSWLPISPFSPWVRWAFVVTEPFLRPLRAILPRLGAFDISPLVAYFLLGFVESFFIRMAAMGMPGA